MRKCDVGQVFYTPWCDSAGKVLDDGTVARLEDRFFRLTSAEPSLRWLRMNAVGLDAGIEDVTDRIAALSLQGPTSRAVLKDAGAPAIDSLKFFRLQRAELRGIPVTITRTGYTGDLGFEIWMANEHAEAIWDDHRVSGTGSRPRAVRSRRARHRTDRGGADSAGRGLHLGEPRVDRGSEVLSVRAESRMDRCSRQGTVCGPARAGSRARASTASGSFVGLDVEWESLEALYAAVHLPPRLPAMAWRTSVPIYKDGAQIGYATSGCWSPLLKKYVALAHLRAPHGAVGQPVEMEITVEHHRRRASATVAKLPFFDPERKRK